MEQTRGYDPTLPLDFDGSSNMNGLEEVTFGEDPSSHDLTASNSRTMSQGSGLLFPNLLAKSNSGRMSPVRGRTMKEYDQQITELKKENFSLKLRIYFLEERMQQKYGDGEDVFKTNIELKVNVQSLKKELEDKQELLRKASQAIETLTSSQQSDIDSVKKSLEDQHHKYTEELRSDLQKALQDAEDAREELESGREKMNELEVRLQQFEMDQQQSTISAQKLKDAIEMKEREISALQLESDSLSRDVEDVRRQLQEAATQRDAAQQKVQQLEKDVQRRGRDVEDVVDDQRDNLGHLETRVAELEGCLNNKDNMIGKLEEGLKEKEKALKDATNQVQQLNKELEEEKRLGSRRDKTIVGLVTSLHKKDKEMASTKARLSKSEGALKTMKTELHKAEVANHESMIKSLGKKEGELAGFRDQLQQANQALKRSEEALEGLQEQLEKERNQAHSRQDKQAQDYQHMVEDYLRQLEGKDSLLAHMTAQLRAKDQQLSSLMNLLTDDTDKGQQMLLLQKLEDNLDRSSGSVQSILEEKQAELDQKGRELLEARQALRSKGRELEQANLQLLEKQEELENLQLHSTQQGEATVRLSNTLAKAQESLEEALDRHAHALQEKDAVVERLQKALAEKECMVEELTNESPAMDKLQQQLRAQLREKDQLIQELQTDCVKASCEKEQALRSSQATLLEKDRQIQALDQKQQKELLNRDQEIQQLMTQLNKKDLQLQGLESRLNEAEASHREALHSMHRMLAEKDKTIEAMMDSVGEKERLLRRSQQNLTEDAKAQMAEMDTLLAENSRLKRLLREKEEALQEEIRQRSHYSNRETHHTSYHESASHTNTGDNAQICRLLEEQLQETKLLSDLLRQDRHPVMVNLSTEHVQSGCHSREEGGRTSSEAALQAELSAVSALRQRLQESLEKNHHLHHSLLGHTSRYADHLLSGECSPDSDNQPRLSIPRPQHTQQQQQQQRSSSEECDGGPSVGSSSSAHRPLEHSPQQQGDAASTSGKGGGGHRTSSSSLAVQTSPFLTHTLFERGGPLSREDTSNHANCPPVAGLGAGEGKGELRDYLLELERSISEEKGLAREASQDSIASTVHSPSSAEVAGMSAPVLRDLVSQLQEDLVASAQRNAMLQKELQEAQGEGRHRPSPERRGGGCLDSSGANTSSAVDLQEEVESLRKALQLKDEETTQLRQHLGLPSEPGSSLPPASSPLKPADLHSQVHDLRHHVKDMDDANKALKQQIAVSRASDQNPDPQRRQIVSMTQEIERLKRENSHLSARMMKQLQGGKKDGGGGGGGSGMQEVSLGGDVSDGFAMGQADLSEVSLLSSMSPEFPVESFSQELSRNTNRYADSSHSQGPICHQWGSLALSGSQSSQSDSEWAPRVMQGEGGVGSKLPPLAKMKRNGKDSVGAGGGPPLANVGRRLQESQEQVKTLEDRLVATEGTVRYMSQRLRHYRSLLQAVKGGKRGQDVLVGVGLPRTQSDSYLFPQSRLSLSLSCSDLREAAQSSGGLGPDSVGGANTSAMSTTGGGVGQSANVLDVQQTRTPSKNSHSIMNTLNQHIKALKERCSQGADTGKPGSPHLGGLTLTTQQEEDGGSNMSGQSSQLSRGTMRGDITSDLKSSSRLPSQSEKNGTGVSDNTTAMSEVSGSGSELSHRQDRRVAVSASHGSQGNARLSLSPQEMTVGEDVLDGTAIDNLTYSSFSESILPIGRPEGHRDSAWSFPRGPGQQGKPAHQVADEQGRSAENPEGNNSSGDETTYDGNGTLHSNLTANEDGSQEESSRLKNRVMVLTDMNRTLREELSVYDSLCRSLGVQVSAVSGEESGGEDSSDGQIRLLQLHLAELKRLRERLELLDTEAHNAVQMTSLLNNQHIKRIAELEAIVAQLRAQLAQQTTLSDQRQTVIVERERVIHETKIVHEQQEKEIQLLRDNLAALQECEVQRSHQQEAEVAELQQQIGALRAEMEESQQQSKDLERELEESRKQRQSYDAKFSQSQQLLVDLESQLSKAKRRAKAQEAELHKSQLSCQDLQSQLAAAKSRTSSLDDDARVLRQTSRKLESDLKESSQRVVVLETRLTQAETSRNAAERDLAQCQENLQSLEEEVKELHQQKEEACSRLQEEEVRGRHLLAELTQVREEWRRMETHMTQCLTLKEECQQQQQRAQHYQERMAHYEQCMRDYQHRVHECESQVEQLKSSLQSSQSREQEADSSRHQALSHVQQLQAQLKAAEGRAHTNENVAHRADTLARTLEGRLREMEVKVKEMEERSRELEYELQASQVTVSERSVTIETMSKEAAERSSKLKKRDAQLTKLVTEYKRVIASQKETEQLNQTLKTEIKLYESMTSQTMSCSKKEDLMKQLLHELSQTRRLAEDVISRLEHSKRNDSPASTAGPEAADGRPSPEPRDSLHSMLSEANILRVHTDIHNSLGHSQASSLSDHSYPPHADSPAGCTPLSSPGGSTFSGPGARPKMLIGATSQEGETSGNESSGGFSVPMLEWPVEGENRKGVDNAGAGHLRSYSHPTSLKYWRDHPLAALSSGPAGAPRVEVDSDVRRLFAISSLDGYEKLKRENGELLSTLSSMQARMTERLKAFTGVSVSEVIKSVEYSTLRELQMSAQNLRICAEEEGRLLSCFWLTQLPPLNARGEFYDPKLADENETMKTELRKQKSRYDLLVHTVREQQERLHATNALRKRWETTLYKQLNHTNGILERSKENFNEAGLTPPPKSKSPRKSGQPIKDKN